MKFQKGILSEEPEPVKVPATPPAKRSETPRPPSGISDGIKGEHLFETLDKETGSSRRYARLFAAVVLLVIGVGIAIAYFTLPGVGDKVRDPGGYEDAVREHFLTKEKRTATDIVFYKCDGFFAAKVGVEVRYDIPNPVFKLDTYSARISKSGDQWAITASPLADASQFVACK